MTSIPTSTSPQNLTPKSSTNKHDINFISPTRSKQKQCSLPFRFIPLAASLFLFQSQVTGSVVDLTDLHFSIEELSVEMQGNTVKDHQVWRFDPSQPNGSEIASTPTLDNAITGVPSISDIDAYSLSNQIHYFSLKEGSGGTALRVDGKKYDRDVIIAYDPAKPAGSRASTYFDPTDYMTTSLQVDGFSFTDDHTILLSFANNGTFANLPVKDGDIVRFDASNPQGTITKFFDETIFLNATDGSDNENIIGFEFRFDDLLYLSTSSSARLPGLGADFQKSDIIGWDGTTAWVALDSSSFDAASDFTINAIYAVPEPETWALVFALVCLVALGVKKPNKE